jgi:D-amino-acid oxidase
VVVVGAGVVGLTCAVRLAERGHQVDVLARDLPLETTSAVAAALWYPYAARPRDRVLAWAETSYGVLSDLAADPRSGVRMLAGTEVLGADEPDPWWAPAVPDLTRTAPPAGWPDAWSFTAPVVDMGLYLPWLRSRLEELGGSVTRLALGALPDPTDAVVVNCSALGSRRLAGDADVHPARGQVMLVEGVDLDRWWLDEGGPTYVVPRLDRVVVGGTFEDGDWSRSPSTDTAAAVWRRAVALVPALGAGTVVAHRVGLRPARSRVRLETEDGVVHCYGHGGAGVTLSWGCADEVVRLVEEVPGKPLRG